MNRILLFVGQSEDRSERQRKRLRALVTQHAGRIEELTRGIVSLGVVERDGEYEISGCIMPENELGFNVPASEMGRVEEIVAAELRQFAQECLEAAARLEGGAA